MPRRPRRAADPTRPRKPPRQQRSEATVAAIVEATRRVLVKEGFEHVTTNRIAELAGVSVGSVYQYFPGKEALIAKVVEDRTADTLRQIPVVARGLRGAPFEQAARTFLSWYVERWRRDRDLLRAIVPHLEAVRRLELVRDQNAAAAKAIALGLARYTEELRACDLELVSLLLVTTAEAVMMRALGSDELLDHPQLDEELALLLTRYLASAPRC